MCSDWLIAGHYSLVMPKSSYNLRSNSSLLLEPPRKKMLSTLGARSFYAAAPCLWNGLPAELRDIQSLYVILNENLRPTFFGQARTFFLIYLLIYFIN